MLARHKFVNGGQTTLRINCFLSVTNTMLTAFFIAEKSQKSDAIVESDKRTTICKIL